VTHPTPFRRVNPSEEIVPYSAVKYNINSMVSESPRRALSNDINIVGEFVELKKLLSKTTIFGGGHFFLSHTVWGLFGGLISRTKSGLIPHKKRGVQNPIQNPTKNPSEKPPFYTS
jgi:hypothetical protein